MLHFIDRSAGRQEAAHGGHRFALLQERGSGGEERWLLDVNGEIIGYFGSLTQAKRAAQRFADGLFRGFEAPRAKVVGGN
jgi:hypothetical protein